MKAEENTFDKENENEKKENEGKVVLVDTIKDVRSTTVNIGNEIGDTCPVCREGTVEDVGGCNTCTNCGAQLKCGL